MLGLSLAIASVAVANAGPSSPPVLPPQLSPGSPAAPPQLSPGAVVASAPSGCRVYARDRIYYSNLLATVQDRKVYEKGKVYYAGLLATVVVSEGMWKVYRRDRTYYAALMATVKSGKVYAGDRVYYSNLLATVRVNKVFERDRTHYAGLLFTGVGCSADELGATAAALCTDDDDGLCRRS